MQPIQRAAFSYFCKGYRYEVIDKANFWALVAFVFCNSLQQLNQRDAQSSLNSAIEAIQENIRKGSTLIDPQHVAPKSLRTSVCANTIL